jgi:hypothetical protein
MGAIITCAKAVEDGNMIKCHNPFFGSGTVGVVAKKFKRDYVGIELNPDYAEMARTRLDQTQPALFAR